MLDRDMFCEKGLPDFISVGARKEVSGFQVRSALHHLPERALEYFPQETKE
jgi:hypothetical protein